MVTPLWLIYARKSGLSPGLGWLEQSTQVSRDRPPFLPSKPGPTDTACFPPFSNHTARDSPNRNSLTPFPACESKSWPNTAFSPPQNTPLSPPPPIPREERRKRRRRRSQLIDDLCCLLFHHQRGRPSGHSALLLLLQG